MSTQSKQLNRFCRGLIAAVALPAVIVMFGMTSARAGVAGAIYTSTSTGTKVNANLYALKSDVYLNGGPQNQNDPGIVPDGTYYFQVTNPNGDLLLSSDCAVCRQVTVLHGRIVGSTGPSCKHAEGTLNPDNKQTPVQLIPYDNTDNPGGEYKAWLIPVSAATIDATDCRILIFDNSVSKTDNFKVAEGATTTGACCLPDGNCTVTTPGDCLAQGGTYQTDGSACDVNTCPPTGCVCTFSFHDCPDDTSVQCYADVPAAASVTATENCNGGPEHAVVVTYQGQTESSSGSKCGNTIMRIWTATDDCLVEYTCSQVIMVNDTTAPVLSGCPAATASYQCLADVPAAPTVTATDNCDGALTPGFDEQRTGDVCSGMTIVRTWSVQDSCNNPASCTQTITVKDTTAPTITDAGGNKTIYCPASPVFTPPTASDNCGSATVCVISDVTTAGSCGTYSRTVTWQAKDGCGNKSVATRSQTIRVECTSCGGLTMGFWQNKNGQALITGGLSTAGVCNSGTWLRQYAPFQDLSASASCNAVATYVYNVIKAANASGAAMNAMLKAQMLATALDVYFSNPALGGNKISAPAPIGGDIIDLTHICKMIDGSGGTATCSSIYQPASGAFGGASCMTVSQMLAYAASQSNVGGSTWYGQVKATQEMAKNAFDAINNRVAFSAFSCP